MLNLKTMDSHPLKISILESRDVSKIETLMHKNLVTFSTPDSVVSAIFRRVTDLIGSYSKGGSQFYVIKNRDEDVVGCAGLGALHGLPVSEGVGEIRDLVVDERFRGQGFGKELLLKCVREAKNLGYKCLYLETSSAMVHAQKLFIRTGFRPIASKNTNNQDLPCYFLMEHL